MGTRTEVLKCFYSATRWSIPSQVRKVRGFRVWRSRKEITDTWNFKHAVQIDGWRFRLDDVESLYGKLLVLNGCYIWYVHIIYIYSLLCLPGPEIEVVILGDLVTCFALKSPSLERENPGTTLMSLWWIVHRWWWSKFWDWGNLSQNGPQNSGVFLWGGRWRWFYSPGKSNVPFLQNGLLQIIWGGIKRGTLFKKIAFSTHFELI